MNNRVATTERNKLGEDTISGLTATEDMVKFSDPQHQKPENIPINSRILSAARSAYSIYQRKIEEDRIEEERERERKAKETQKAEAARRKQEMEAMTAKKKTLFLQKKLLK